MNYLVFTIFGVKFEDAESIFDVLDYLYDDTHLGIYIISCILPCTFGDSTICSLYIKLVKKILNDSKNYNAGATK